MTSAAATRAWQLAHPERMKANAARWRAAHLEADAARRRAYYEAHKDRFAAYGAERYAEHREEFIARAIAYKKAHPEKVKVWTATYGRKHRSEHAARVYARNRSYVVGHTRAEWEARKVEFDYRCVYCSERPEKLTKDHVIPIRRGDPLTVDRIENIVPACRSCNSSKGVRTSAQRFPFQLHPDHDDHVRG